DVRAGLDVERPNWTRNDFEAAFLSFLDDHHIPRPRTNFHVAAGARLIECAAPTDARARRRPEGADRLERGPDGGVLLAEAPQPEAQSLRVGDRGRGGDRRRVAVPDVVRDAARV